MPAPVYPFDPLGNNPLNIVPNELHTISAVGPNDYQVIIPRCAPFHRAGFTLLREDGSLMYEGIDYTFANEFYMATMNIGTAVYGSVNIFNKTLSETLRIENYKTIGGDWTIDDVAIAQALARINQDPRNITWEQLVNLPYQFPPVNHNHVLDDGTRVTQLYTALENINITLRETLGQSFIEHKAQINAHGVTTLLLNLEKVANYRPATDEEAAELSANDLYATIHTANIVASMLAFNAQVESMAIYTDALQSEAARVMDLINTGV